MKVPVKISVTVFALIVLTVLLVILWGPSKHSSRGVVEWHDESIIEKNDYLAEKIVGKSDPGVPQILIIHDSGKESAVEFCKAMENISIGDDDGRIMFHSTGQKGETTFYSFTIEDFNGIQQITDFPYSGEAAVTVVRRADWFLHISHSGRFFQDN